MTKTIELENNETIYFICPMCKSKDVDEMSEGLQCNECGEFTY